MTPRRYPCRGVTAFGVNACLDHRSAAKQALDETTIRSLDKEMAADIQRASPHLKVWGGP